MLVAYSRGHAPMERLAGPAWAPLIAACWPSVVLAQHVCQTSAVTARQSASDPALLVSLSTRTLLPAQSAHWVVLVQAAMNRQGLLTPSPATAVSMQMSEAWLSARCGRGQHSMPCMLCLCLADQGWQQSLSTCMHPKCVLCLDVDELLPATYLLQLLSYWCTYAACGLPAISCIAVSTVTCS